MKNNKITFYYLYLLLVASINNHEFDTYCEKLENFNKDSSQK